VYAYVYPYGSSTSDLTNSAYGGTWDVSLCLEFPTSAPTTVPPTNQLEFPTSAPLPQVRCAATSGDNDKPAKSIELTDLAVGDEFQYAFTTYGQDGEEGYQNIGLILCKVKVDTYFDCADEDRYLYTRGSSSGTDHVEGNGVYAYVYPYGGSTSDLTNSAYGGTWDLSLCSESGGLSNVETTSPTPTSVPADVTQSPGYMPAIAPGNPGAIVTWKLSLCCLEVSDLVHTVISIAVLLELPEEAVTLRSWTLILYHRRRTDSGKLVGAWDLTYDIEVESSDAANEMVEAVSSSDTTSALEDQIMEDIPGSTVNVTSSFGKFTVLEEGEKAIEVWLEGVIAMISLVFILRLAICCYRKKTKAKLVVGIIETTTPTSGEERIISTNNHNEGEREPDISTTLIGVSPTAQIIKSADYPNENS